MVDTAVASKSTLNQQLSGKEKRVLYETDKDSSGSKWARCLSCRCLGQKVEITSEYINTREWKGCSRIESSLDIDKVEDIQLREPCGCTLLFCKHGDIRVYGKDGDDKDKYFTCYHVEDAGNVFLQLGEVTHKLNDLKYGMKRPDDPSIQKVMYNSADDGACVKCIRTSCCGCFRPSTVVTKTSINQSVFECGKCAFVTKRLDFDHITDLQRRQKCHQMCCNAGDIRVYGKDQDQTSEYFDVTWIQDTKEKFTTINDFWNRLNNRERVGFE